MNLPLTYGQCLRRIMQQNQLSINTLSRKMGYRSATQLARILNDEVSPSLITKFHHQFMLIFDWLISPAQIRELSVSLQYSCLGHDEFLTRRAMYRMLLSPLRPNLDAIPLYVFPEAPPSVHTLNNLLDLAKTYEKIELLVVGSAYDTLLPTLSDLAGKGRLHIRHVFAMEEQPARIISQLSAIVPFLNTDAYTGLYCTQATPDVCLFVQNNPVAIARCQCADGSLATSVFMPPQKDGVNLCLIEGNDTLYSFFEAMLARYRDHLLPIKSVYPRPKTVENLLTLCERDLFLEQSRSCCIVRLDLCFQALPEESVLAALDNGARIGLTLEDPITDKLRSVHRERFHDFMQKSEPTYLILSLPAMERFMQTGHLSDHLFAMRDFTVDERKTILSGFIAAARANGNLHVHVFADADTAPIGCFSSYEGMGVQVSANNTAYNIADNHSEAFVSLPTFADTFTSYCKDILIPEMCLDEAQTLSHLQSLLDSIPEA